MIRLWQFVVFCFTFILILSRAEVYVAAVYLLLHSYLLWRLIQPKEKFLYIFSIGYMAFMTIGTMMWVVSGSLSALIMTGVLFIVVVGIIVERGDAFGHNR